MICDERAIVQQACKGLRESKTLRRRVHIDARRDNIFKPSLVNEDSKMLLQKSIASSCKTISVSTQVLVIEH